MAPGSGSARVRARRCGAVVALLAVAACAAACGTQQGPRVAAMDPAGATSAAGQDADPDGSADGRQRPAEPPTQQLDDPAAQDGVEGRDVDLSEFAMPEPGPLETPLLPADIMVYAARPFPASVRSRVAGLDEVTLSQPMSRAQVALDGRTVNVVAADPGLYRRFTPYQAAQLDEIWNRVAGGEIAVAPKVGDRYADDKGYLTLGSDRDAPRLHVGAYSPMVPQVDALVNPRWGKALGMVPGNALLVSTGRSAPQEILQELQRIAGPDASVSLLGPDLDVHAVQTAFLTGGSVASAIGSFSYTANPDGTVTPDPGWVGANIVTEDVPILGAVTCHRVMLPQLRAALAEIVDRGLAAQIHADQYGGCYYPRFIAYDSAQGLSNHTFGIAVDLNVPENARGTSGAFSQAVVDVFAKWGFGWGGYWSYTDPMHFELRALVEAR